MVGTVGAARGWGLVGAGSAFAAGLGAGAVLLFGGLGLLGSALHPGTVLLVAAGVLAGLAALGDLAGLRVRPQVRFQVPESWRRTMPLPRALFLYGVLLGTGASTYVPALAAWALLAVSFALGSTLGAILIGLAFALGRALPIVALAVRGGSEALSERPGGLRVARVLGAVMLTAASAALLASAVQARTLAYRAEDPSAAGFDLAWQRPGVGGFLRRAGVVTRLPGTDPALGGGNVAWRNGNEVTVADVETDTPIFRQQLPGVEKLAVSDAWLAYRSRRHGRVRILARPLASSGVTRAISKARLPGVLSRPALDGTRLVFSVTTRRESRIMLVDLSTGKAERLRRSRSAQLLNPSLLGSRLLYDRIGRCSQKVRVGSIGGGGHGRVLLKLPPPASWDAGHERDYSTQGRRRPCNGRPRHTRRMLWTTALAADRAYVTVLRPSAGGFTPKLLVLSR